MTTRSFAASAQTEVKRHRPAAVRRRRLLGTLVGGLALVGAIVVAWPTVHHAVRDLTLPLHHADVIRQQAREKHLDPALIAAVIDAESKFNDQDTSAAGAIGLMQLLPDTAASIAQRSGATNFSTADLSTPQVNIAYGSWYLQYLLGRYQGNVVLALAAYNGGEANVDKWLAQASSDGDSFTTSQIPFPETRAYVRRVLDLRGQYRSNYASELGL